LGLAAFWIGAIAGCTSHATSPGPDAGQDASTTGDASSGVPASGTSGRACTTNTDCAGAGGAVVGINVCSNSSTVVQTVTGVKAQLWPTPVCIVPPSLVGNCDPAPLATDPDGLKVHFCDGPDDPSSPGVCVPLDPSNPRTGLGVCYPKCHFQTNATPAAGCVGVDTCAFLGYTLGPAGDAGDDAAVPVDGGLVLRGVGYCQGSCQSDGDCAALGSGYGCQLDLGYCTLNKVFRSKQLGAACTTNDSDAGVCNCFTGASGNGFCSSRCVVGGNACPAGWVCDTGEPATVQFTGLGPTTSVVGPTPGMVGMCAPACSPDLDGGRPDASTAVDAGAVDGSPGADAGADGESDATAQDASVQDASVQDASVQDASVQDASVQDASASEASAQDAQSPADGSAADGAAPTDAGATADGGEAGGGSSGGCVPNSTCVSGGAVGADCLPH
jgi:hypothetical protein